MVQIIDRFDGTKYRYLSNFTLAPVLYEGIEFPSSEHAYQAAKFPPIKVKRRIASLITPGEAKRAGKQLGIRLDWEDVKVGIMTEIVTLKFVQNRDMRNKLLSTGNALLIEGNNWGDTFWGKVDGVGKNHLGEILMKVREDLRNDM